MKTTVNGEVLSWEVERVIQHLKCGKTVGVDGVVGEILTYGGEWMTESVWLLCRAVFEGEELPLTWLRTVKVAV